MERMIENRVHRLWVVADEDSLQVIGVVSQSDILSALLGIQHIPE
jgi:CBS domain-containing protein